MLTSSLTPFVFRSTSERTRFSLIFSHNLTFNERSLTEFMATHPGGVKPIMANAGKDATKIFESIHAKGLLESMLRPDQRVGAVDPATMPHVEPEYTDDDLRVIRAKRDKPPLGAMINLMDIEDVARKVMTKQAWHYYRSEAEDGYSKWASVLWPRRGLTDFKATGTISLRSNIISSAQGCERIALLRYNNHLHVIVVSLRELRPVNTETSILGIKCSLPIFVR